MGAIDKTAAAGAAQKRTPLDALALLHAQAVHVRIERLAPTVAQFDVIAKASRVVQHGIGHDAAVHGHEWGADWRQKIDAIMSLERDVVIANARIDLRIFTP